MRKGRDRAQRRNRFDDDDVYSGPDQERPRQPFQQAPRANAMPSGPAIDATVKWFNPEKGFGFVELGDGSGDAFLHIAVLEGAGHETVLPGSKLRVQIGQGQKGPQVTAVLEVHASAARRLDHNEVHPAGRHLAASVPIRPLLLTSTAL